MNISNVLTESISNRLNLLRWVAAMVVLLGHIEMVVHWGTNESLFPWLYHMAHLSVMAFFVLSGFIIAHVTFKTDSIIIYYEDRATRIYSVLLPAILLTIILDTIGSKIYSDFYIQYLPSGDTLVRFLVNILGLQGWQGHRVQLGTNSPLWSIGYEVFFYAIFGIWHFKIKSHRSLTSLYTWILILIMLMIAAGIQMVSYLIIWLLGVVTFFLRNKIRLPTSVFFLSISLISYFLITISPSYLQDFLFALCISGFLLLPDGRTWFRNQNKLIAGFSYSLYAIHLPIIFFLTAVLRTIDLHIYLLASIVFIVPILAAYFFASIFENNRYQLRALIRKHITRCFM